MIWWPVPVCCGCENTTPLFVSARLRLRSFLPETEETDGVGEGIDMVDEFLFSFELGVVSVFVVRNDIAAILRIWYVKYYDIRAFRQLALPVTSAKLIYYH